MILLHFDSFNIKSMTETAISFVLYDTELTGNLYLSRTDILSKPHTVAPLVFKYTLIA